VNAVGYWLAYLAGLTDASGWPYLLWSGIVGDAAIFAAAWSIVRRHNCEVHGCWRVGKHQTAAGHRVCRRHHPDETLTAQDVLAAHRASL
jgi:hypothetical protein